MKEYLASRYGMMPDTGKDMTQAFQKALDACAQTGGRVVIPQGEYIISSVKMGSNTEIYLQKDAKILGSENCEDYTVWPVSEGVELYTDQQAFGYLSQGPSYPFYRRAMISAYGEKNIAIIGEEGSVIDGRDCFDPNGEENFRGPHTIFLTGCENVHLKGYTVANGGNFMHEADGCENVLMEEVTCLGGHDGIHLHRSRHMEIQNCTFRTGDDCVAGCDVFDVKVTGCTFNTSCNVFRIGGIGVLIENCKAEGPGYYPHRMTVVRGKNDVLPRTEGRHNTITLIEYFASRNFSNDGPSRMTVRGCHVRGVDAIINYRYDQDRCLHAGMDLGEVVFENVLFEDLERTSCVLGNEKRPTQLRFKNVQATYKNGQDLPLVVGNYVCIAQE